MEKKQNDPFSDNEIPADPVRKKTRFQIDLEVASRGFFLTQQEDPRKEAAKLYKKFKTSKKEAVKNAAALKGFFQKEGISPAEKEEYGRYLREHILPSCSELVEENDYERFSVLEQNGWITKEDLDLFIEQAETWKKTDILVNLMHLKNEKYGFTDTDFSI